MSTIAAISTPNAAGGIGIVRLSGENAVTIAARCFRPLSGKDVNAMKGYTAAYGTVFDGQEELDDGVLLVYRAPHSYTGENTAEICCHGGLFIMQKVLRTVLSLGAEPAGPGEFTKRAYLNGKMDLSQAESVMNVISAQGAQALTAARNTLKGNVSKKINEITSSLIAAAAALAAWADYPDEDIPAVQTDALRETLVKNGKELDSLIKRYDAGRTVTQGVNTVICGKPNVGKSTLMNLLTGFDRSIVTSVAGTTRDVVEETVRVGSTVLRLADTAGLHETSDLVESIGVNIAKERIDSADLVLAVFDVSRELTEEDKELIETCRDKKCIAVINKTDLEHRMSLEEIKENIPCVVEISAKNGEATALLEEALMKLLGTEGLDFNQEILAGERQRDCCVKALENINEGISALDMGLTADAVNVSIDCAVEALLTLTGKKASEEIVSEVFRTFCVGK